MDILKDLILASEDVGSLEMFIAREVVNLRDFLSIQNHSALHEHRIEFDRYLKGHRQVLTSLDLTNVRNVEFLILLLEICDRIALPFSISFLFEEVKRSGAVPPKRLIAAHRYLIQIEIAEGCLESLEPICLLLQQALEEEEDSIQGVITTIANFYALVVYDYGEFNMAFVHRFRDAILVISGKGSFEFLSHEFITQLLEVDLSDFRVAYLAIQAMLDAFLNRRSDVDYRRRGHFIEEGSDYCIQLGDCAADFDTIKGLSAERHRQNPAGDAAYRSLNRGVAVLDSEKALFAYMYSFGSMHFAKLVSAFDCLPLDRMEGNALVVDWACGQGLATMAFLDFLMKKKRQIVGSVLLIEPSELAIRRATLHVGKWITNPIRIHAVHSDFDSLSVEDLDHAVAVPKIHLFSNILDVELFQLGKLQSLIVENFKGENYFVCVSPFVNDSKRNRLDMFVYNFSKMTDFQILYSADNARGTWPGKGDWTRVVRVFKVTI